MLRAGSAATVLADRGPLAVHAAEFDDLLDRTDAPLAARWPSLDTWLRHHPEQEPWAVLVRRGTRAGGELVGAAVFARRQRFGCWKFDPVGVEGEPVHLAAVDPPAAGELAGAVRDALARLDRPWFLRLTDLPAPDPVVTALTAELPVSNCHPGPAAPQLPLAPGEPLTAYLSRNTRAALAKARNRIARDQLAEHLAWTAAADRVAADLPEVMDVHRRRSLQMHGRSALDDAATRGYFEAAVAAHAAAGRVRLLTLRLDAALAAFALCLLDRDLLWVYANMVSPDWLRYSAGTISNAEVVRWAHATPGLAGINWGAGLQRYKLSGPVTLTPSQHLHAWSSRGLRLAVAARNLAGSTVPPREDGPAPPR